MSRVEPTQDPRIAKKEMIITRFKSAQQKKQKEKQDQPAQTKPFGLKIHQSTSKQQTAKLTLKIAKASPKMAKPQTVTKEPTVAKLPETTKSIQNKPVKKPKPKSQPKQKETVPQAKSPILIEDDYPEYYPEKTKRAPGSKRVFLKPKQKSTMIARTNKRKFNTPKRGANSLQPNKSFSSDVEPANSESPAYSELSMAEVIRIMEENDSLDDEDLMEILTCPSPVWWEEPPDEMYIEEAICSRQPEESPAGKTKSPIRERCLNTLRNSAKFGNKAKTQDNTEPALNNMNTEVKKDDKFIKKSKKLENVLGNIKNKACKSNDLVENCVKQEKLDDIKQTDSENKSNNVIDSNYDSNVNDASENISTTDKEANESTSEDVNDIKKEGTNEESNKRRKKMSESTEGSYGDMNSQNQELLLDLENMNIPIEDVNSPDCIIINDDNSNKIIDVDAADDKLDDINENHDMFKEDASNCTNTNKEINSVDNTSNNNTKEQKSKDNITEICNDVDDEQSLVPKNLPPLIKCPKIENNVFTSPNSYRSISDDVTESSSISGIDMMDTISDTNIKFITDDDIDDVSDSDNKNKKDDMKNESDSNKNNSVTSEDKIIELKELAVLKNEPDSKNSYSVLKNPKDESAQKPKNIFKNIPEYSSYVENLIQSEIKPDITDDSLENEIPDVPDTKGQLNSFYKKCKNANRKRKRIEVVDKTEAEKTESECKSPKKSITVAQEENVKYCLKCSSIFDTEDCSYCMKSDTELEKTYTCDKCDFVGKTSNASEHLEEHNIDEEEKT